MKQFFEQYGGVALEILALLVLIAMITPVGNIIKTSLQGTVQTFSTKMDGQVDTMTESMNAAFTNATDFTGVKDNKIYINGSIPNCLAKYTVSEDGYTITHDDTGHTLSVVFDLNTCVDGVKSVYGQEGLLFDVYFNGNKIGEGVEDFTFPISLKENDTFKVVQVSQTDVYEMQDDENKTTQDLMIDLRERMPNDMDYEQQDIIYFGWYVNIVSK